MKSMGLDAGLGAGDRAEIEGLLPKIVGSEQFARATKASEFLTFVVGEALAGRGQKLNAFLVAQEVYSRGNDFDPNDDRVVSQGARDVRNRLREYYDGEGRSDPWRIDLPKGTFAPEFTRQSVPDPAIRSTEESLHVARQAPRPRRIPKALILGAAALALVLLGLVLARLIDSTIRITSPADGATVGPVGYVTGSGWHPELNNYLVVEPVDGSGRRWIEARIASENWTRSAYFGQVDTPSGMQFRVYLLSTKSDLPIGELTREPENPQESAAVTVTLRK
jgi:hypothetical protein